MSLDPIQLANILSEETGLALVASTGIDGDGQQWILLTPAGVSRNHAFGIRTTIGWRRMEVAFEPGDFARPLLSDMSRTDAEGRSIFLATIDTCRRNGADVLIRINGQVVNQSDQEFWADNWRRFELSLRKGNLEIGDADGRNDFEISYPWILRFTAAVLSLLPFEAESEISPPDNQRGFPEGAKKTIVVNRYERDRRNRAAAIAIHGSRCLACGFDFGSRYGSIAAGFIEVHHVVPVSRMIEGYIVNPQNDLIPLCSNCHSVVHKEDPPLTLQQLLMVLRLHST